MYTRPRLSTIAAFYSVALDLNAPALAHFASGSFYVGTSARVFDHSSAPHN